MIKVVMLVLPAFAIIFFVAFKLPPKAKDWFFLIPTWLSSSLVAWIIGHHMAGVMGGYAGILCDFILMPAFWLIKEHHTRQRKKEGRPAPLETFRLAKA